MVEFDKFCKGHSCMIHKELMAAAWKGIKRTDTIFNDKLPVHTVEVWLSMLMTGRMMLDNWNSQLIGKGT